MVSLSLSDLVRNRMLSPEMAGILAVAAAECRSMLFVAGPRMAGKTTLMDATLEHRPDGVPVHSLSRSAGPSLGIPARPGTSDEPAAYLRLSEIAPTGFDDYFWGPEVQQVFAALDQGFALATALHAHTLEEALEVLAATGVNEAAQSHFDLVCVIHVIGHWESPQRRAVEAIYELDGVESGELRARLLHRWREAEDRFEAVEAPAFIGNVVGDLDERTARFAGYAS